MGCKCEPGCRESIKLSQLKVLPVVCTLCYPALFVLLFWICVPVFLYSFQGLGSAHWLQKENITCADKLESGKAIRDVVSSKTLGIGEKVCTATELFLYAPASTPDYSLRGCDTAWRTHKTLVL